MVQKTDYKYIIKNKYGTVYKILVTDITKTSIGYRNVDTNSVILRETLENFNRDYTVLEEIEPSICEKYNISKDMDSLVKKGLEDFQKRFEGNDLFSKLSDESKELYKKYSIKF